MNAKVSIVGATPDQAACLTPIAHESKASWGYPAEWLHAWRDTMTITPEFMCSHTVRVAIVAGRIIGFLAVLVAGDVARLEHLWVLPTFMGRGIGTGLFREAVRVAEAAGAREIVIESDPNAAHFYERRGAQITSYSESDVCGTKRRLPVFRMATSSLA